MEIFRSNNNCITGGFVQKTQLLKLNVFYVCLLRLKHSDVKSFECFLSSLGVAVKGSTPGNEGQKKAAKHFALKQLKRTP